MASEDSGVKMQKKSETKPELKDQDAKKITTKDMLHQALTDLKSRKGTSLYAIKKYLEENYKVDVEKLNYVIKKSLKSSVEAGTIIQTKGIGASGSFRLAPAKDLPAKKKKPKAKNSVEKPTTAKKSSTKEKVKKTQSTEKDDSAKQKKKVDISEPASGEKKEKTQKESKKTTNKEAKMKKTKAAKMAEEVTRTPAKKKSAMMKRKSIGSIIKPPKMNPKKG